MKYHILGICAESLTFPSILCRLTNPIQARKLGQQEIMHGSFFGTLPDPEVTELEAVAFDTFEAAETYVKAEKAAGSTWIYAIHCSQTP